LRRMPQLSRKNNIQLTTFLASLAHCSLRNKCEMLHIFPLFFR
jgi:hypothetical protein